MPLSMMIQSDLDILDTYYAFPIKNVDLGQLLMSITTLIRNHQLRLPNDIAGQEVLEKIQ